MAEGVGRTVAALGTTQTLAWASSYYLPAMLAVPMVRSLGVTVSTVFAAFSAALVVSAVLGPYAGRAIGRWGGKPVLLTSNLVFALGLASLASAQGSAGLFAGWLVIGLAMGSGLYEAAFAAVVRLYGFGSRGSRCWPALQAPSDGRYRRSWSRMSMPASPTASAGMSSKLTEGEALKVDVNIGRVTLRHGPIENLGMPGMTMMFPVSDKKMLAGIKDGDKVRFRAERRNGMIVVTEIVSAR